MAYVIDHRMSVGEPIESLGQLPIEPDKPGGLPTPIAIIGALAVLWLMFKILK